MTITEFLHLIFYLLEHFFLVCGGNLHAFHECVDQIPRLMGWEHSFAATSSHIDHTSSGVVRLRVGG